LETRWVDRTGWHSAAAGVQGDSLPQGGLLTVGPLTLAARGTGQQQGGPSHSSVESAEAACVTISVYERIILM